MNIANPSVSHSMKSSRPLSFSGEMLADYSAEAVLIVTIQASACSTFCNGMVSPHRRVTLDYYENKKNRR